MTFVGGPVSPPVSSVWLCGGPEHGEARPGAPAWVDLSTYLPEDILVKVDRMTMAVGLEARVPFLDHRLVELAEALPTRLKYRGGRTKCVAGTVLETLAGTRGMTNLPSGRAGRLPAARRSLLLLVPDDWYFLSHRAGLAVAAHEAGFDVTVGTRVTMPGRLQALPIEVVDVRFPAAATSLTYLWKSVWSFVRVYRKVRPDLVNAVTLKTALPAAIAGLAFPDIKFVLTVAGLGYLFTGGGKGRAAVGNLTLRILALLSRSSRVRVIVQNESDWAALARYIREEKLRLVPGTGVDVTHFVPLPEPQGEFCIGYAGRMLVHKGLPELIEALRILRGRSLGVRAILAGRTDTENPTAVSESVLRGWEAEGLVSWRGEVADIRELWRDCHVAVLPSFREGFSRALVEAAACGRALIASDIPGCREVARNGVTGLLVPPGDPAALADAIAKLREDRECRETLARNARATVETEFSAARIEGAVLGVFEEALR